MKLSGFGSRAKELIAQADSVSATLKRNDYGSWVDVGAFAQFRAAGLSFLRNAFGEAHPYYLEFDKRVKENDPSDTSVGRGILEAARLEVAGGWTTTAVQIVSAEIFSDFLEMASYLLEAKFKDAAAVMIGSVLEEHLRQLCRQRGMPMETVSNGKTVPKKADVLNGDLGNAAVYGKLDQKSVTAWLDLRNKAAHGRYGEYTQPQVELMLQGVTDFLTRNP